MSKKNMVGQHFGRLEAIERLGNYKSKKTYYRCTCQCGNEKIVSSSNLVTGHTKSCGCIDKIRLHKRKDITGKTFGLLTVVEMIWNVEKSSRKRTYCRCICECGNEKTVSKDNLLADGLHSCGCAKENIMQNACRIDNTGEKHNRLTIKKILWDNKPVLAVCECECGNIVTILKAEVTTGGTKSCGCLQKERASLSNTKDFSGRISNYGIKLLKQHSKNKNGVWLWESQCGYCKKHFTALPAKIFNNHIISCGCKSYSKRELFIQSILEKENIFFMPQYSFKECKDQSALRFDFAILDKSGFVKLLIEYDGEQHYHPVEFWGGSEAFKKSQHRDQIKNTYCKNNNLQLIRFPYTMSEKEIKEELLNIIHPKRLTC